ncbi:fructosamine kinase family protein [Nocardia sp. NPDC023852]|uniref:fructosamine kinase family protein n=1 Tax=Nocardia sp. NPDC023852 TaxID=3154697 RepID=UPI0033D15DB9
MKLSERLASRLGPVRRVTDLGSRHAWTLHRAELLDGRTVFVKASAASTSVFAAEAAGLVWLADADPGAERRSGPDEPVLGSTSIHDGDPSVADSGSARPNTTAERGTMLLPQVLAADDRMLVLPWLAEAGPTPAAAERFGRELAALHAKTPGRFGAPWPGWIATLPLSNTPTAGPWSQWYAEHRLAPYLPRAAAHLGEAGVRLLERVIDRIDALAGPAEPPARIHGDLWSGNLLWTVERVLLVDPAAHGGHRETDLAMLALFGAPHLDRILAAYHETYPLAERWRARIPLHQLHPLLVHVVLFGADYRIQTLAAATAALAE